MSTPPLLSVRDLSVEFHAPRSLLGRRTGNVQALDKVSFDIHAGEIVGILGESGSGKTTVGRCMVRLQRPTAGSVSFEGRDIHALSGPDLNWYRRQVQMIFQDPAASLNPRLRVRDIVAEGLEIHRIGTRESRRQKVIDLLASVGLGEDALMRFAHEFSGGQRQRIGIARAMAVGPRVIVADEPVSALDVSVQAKVINLLRNLRERLGLAMAFISHDLPTVMFLCDRVVIMYLGRVMEIAPIQAFRAQPFHPYSRTLLALAPGLRQREEGDMPAATDLPTAAQDLRHGCAFRNRCPHAMAACTTVVPPLQQVAPGRWVACLRPEIFHDPC
ncbi:ABC transporter ATP-binding protein [Gluconacetobacter entanii]|uniref:Peptide ABC transporter ATP-binding protein n=1 Tax=Gluconacetobacter entanii TaxID=108528 RepID=A0A318PSW2_9PROT|nr:oligopeptide/dipeptide ABC transporter ATP-binding protein [Gluconacetobacter entanii]MCE2577774.1 ATP-binding cassette domain-containing protein [Komagataeibacter sp. FNDCR1]PYD63054.1 peptide ABC transporter ATP-binding protein [Gluconacetobacter entanii]